MSDLDVPPENPDPWKRDVDGRIDERLQVLRIAAELHHSEYDGVEDDPQVLATADSYFNWLISPTRLRVTFGPVTDKTTGEVIAPTLEGSPVQITNTQKVLVQLDSVVDRGGEDIPDDPDTTADDPTFEVDDHAVLEPKVQDDGRSCLLISRHTGTAIFTLTVAGGKIFTEAVDVLHSEADRLNVTFGEVQEKDGTE